MAAAGGAGRGNIVTNTLLEPFRFAGGLGRAIWNGNWRDPVTNELVNWRRVAGTSARLLAALPVYVYGLPLALGVTETVLAGSWLQTALTKTIPSAITSLANGLGGATAALAEGVGTSAGILNKEIFSPFSESVLGQAAEIGKPTDFGVLSFLKDAAGKVAEEAGILFGSGLDKLGDGLKSVAEDISSELPPATPGAGSRAGGPI